MRNVGCRAVRPAQGPALATGDADDGEAEDFDLDPSDLGDDLAETLSHPLRGR